MLTTLVLTLLFLPQAPHPPPAIDWVTLAVERQAFMMDGTRHYETVGDFSGVGELWP